MNLQLRGISDIDLANTLAASERMDEFGPRHGEAAELSQADLHGKDLSDTMLFEAALHGADLGETDLRRSVLS